MKKYLKIRNILLVLIFSNISISLFSQQFNCTYQKVETFPEGYNQNLKGASMITSVNDFKIVRVNIHFLLKTDGTGNFTENKAYIANTVTIAPSSTITISNNKRLFIDSQVQEINGAFDVQLGSVFEFIPNGL